MKALSIALAVAAIAGQACAQPAPAPPGTPPAAAAPAEAAPTATTPPCCLIPTGTVIYLALTEEVSSKVAMRGDHFGIKLMDPIRVGDRIVVPAGVVGGGEVVDAAHAGMGGKPGELVLAARYLNYGDTKIPLRSFKLGGHGMNNSKDAQTAVLLVGVVGLAMRGGDMVLSVGAEAQAKVAADITLPPAAASPPPPQSGSQEGKP